MSIGEWRSDALFVKYPSIREWIIQAGSEEKKRLYLEAIRKFLEFAGGTTEDLIKEAASAEKMTLDDRLKIFMKHLQNQGMAKEKVIEYYLAVRSFYVWNGFIEKLRAVPREFKELKAENAYDWDKT